MPFGFNRLDKLTEDYAPTLSSKVLMGTDEGEVSTIKNILAADLREMSWFVPMTGVTANTFDVTGELRTQASGQVGDYATGFNPDNQHLAILVNTIVAGGDIVITGTSVSESTAVPVTSDTETLVVDTSTDQYYQTTKKWYEITNIDITTGSIDTIDYDVVIVGYLDMANRDFILHGYRAEFKSTGAQSDIAIRIRKVQDDGAGKMSIVTIEHIGVDSITNEGVIVDTARSAARDVAFIETAWASGAMFVFKQLDFDTYFTSDENKMIGTNGEGIIIDFLGVPSGGITAVDHGTITLFFHIL